MLYTPHEATPITIPCFHLILFAFLGTLIPNDVTDKQVYKHYSLEAYLVSFSVFERSSKDSKKSSMTEKLLTKRNICIQFKIQKQVH